MWPAKAFQAHAQSEAVALGGYVGLFAAFTALQLFLWVMQRNGLNGWYLLYILIVTSGALLGTGYLRNTLGIAPALWKVLIGLHVCFTPVATAMLTTTWLDLKHNAPRVGRWYPFAVLGVAVCAGLTVIFGNYRLGLQISQSLTLVWLLTALGLAFWLWRKGSASAGFYLLIFGVMDVGIFVRYLKNLSPVSVNFFPNYAILIVVALHLLFMSLYLIFRHSALQQALKIAERTREEQRDFVNMVSHEFRTPLAIISTSIQQLASNLSAPVEKTAQRCLNIRNATLRMGRLLDDYLSLDRMDTTRKPLRLQTCRILDTLEDVTSDWSTGRVRLEIHNVPPSWTCDPDLMRVVLRNLLANADRHSPADTPITLTTEGLPDGKLQFTINDQGCGIDADERPKLFQKYFRGRASQDSPGSGLGLYLVSQIVKAHQGTVDVQSSRQGTTFTLRFPRL